LLGRISFGVSDLARSGAFYDATLQALGYACVYRSDRAIGYGAPGSQNDRLLLILQSGGVMPQSAVSTSRSRRRPARRWIAFTKRRSPSAAWIRDLPGFDGPAYYAAFVLDAVLEATRAKIAALLGLY